MTINFKALADLSEDIKNFNDQELLIVTKNQEVDDILILIEKNYKLFGENRVQEAQTKFKEINNQTIRLHLIGPLQSNKVKIALGIFDVIQTIDRKSLIDEILKQKQKLKFIKTNEYFIQINIGSEIQKTGVKKNEVKELYDYAINSGLNIIGFMCIPPSEDDPEIYFNEMLSIKNKINSKLKLSMGMSNDYKIALKCHSNLIRVGSLIFSND